MSRSAPAHSQICCPSNLLRTIAELTAYFYSCDDAGIWVHQYGGSQVECRIASGEPLAFAQVTDYPWSGEIKFVVHEAPAWPAAFRLRMPAWAGTAAVAVNGVAAPPSAREHGYARVSRTWKCGDTLTLALPLEPRLVTAESR